MTDFPSPDEPVTKFETGHGEPFTTPEPPPALASFLPDLLVARTPAAAGGVPVPGDWTYFRAVLGGAGRRDVEGQNNAATITTRGQFGTHLAAGLHIFTGQTGGGKSALVTNLADAAIAASHPVLYVSLELDGDELGARLLALRTGVPWWLLAQRRPLSSQDHATATAGVEALASDAERFRVLAPESALSMDDVRRETLRLWRTYGRVPLVVFDYLQAPASIKEAGGWRPQLREQIAAATMALRRISRKMPAETNGDGESWPGCPVVVLSVTARANTKKGEGQVSGMDGKNPDDLRTEDLETLKALPKEAGEVENTAVTAWVMALGEADHGPRPLCLRLAKSRMGPPGAWIPFTFEGTTGKLEEAPERYAIARNADAAKAAAAAAKAERATSSNGRGAATSRAPLFQGPDNG